MKSSTGLNTWGKWLAGLAVLSVIFLSRKSTGPAEKLRPISQNLMGNKRLALLPYIDAQANHETGGFKSRLAVDQNNLFGMKRPQTRPFLGSGVVGDYARYSSWGESVQDLLLWMDYTGFPVSVSGSAEYVEQLKKRNYFEDSISTYLKGVNRGLVELKNSGVAGFKIG